VFLFMGYMNFEVPGKIQHMLFVVEDTLKFGRNWVDMGSYGMVLEVGRCVF
jgi:hypothetical protein